MRLDVIELEEGDGTIVHAHFVVHVCDNGWKDKHCAHYCRCICSLVMESVSHV
jgi:hypothetical protein